MTNIYQLLELLDDNKERLQDSVYKRACDLLCEMHHDEEKEIIINAVIAECIAQAYFSEDEHCVASKVQQRILRIKCTPILRSEMQKFRFKNAAELIQLGKYRESWLTEYRNGEYVQVEKERFPIVVGVGDHHNDISVVISSIEFPDVNRCKRKR